MCTWSGYQKNPTNFPRKYPHRILSKRILHFQLPNSSMLFFDTFQRKLHSVWFKGYHAVFKNRPKKFSFPKKYTHRILSEQILHYQLPNSGMLFFDIFQRKLQSVWFKGYITPYSKIAQRNFHFPRNIQIEYCPGKFFTISSQIQVCCSLVCSNKVSIAA